MSHSTTLKKTASYVTVSPADRDRLDGIIRDRNAARKHVWRAEIIVLSADRAGTVEIMRRSGKAKTCVWRWQERYAEAGIDGLLRDKMRPSRIKPLAPEIGERVVALTLGDPPGRRRTGPATGWPGPPASAPARSGASGRRTVSSPLAGASSSSPTIRFRRQGARRGRSLWRSPGPRHHPLGRRESPIQALDRTQPGPPMKKGRLGAMTHDHKRHGTTTLFAALNVLDGTVIGKNMQRHRHQEFIRFLNTVNAQVPPDKAVHVILDNYATHKHPKVRDWLDRHTRFTFHFTPTSASWLNAVEGFFAILARRRLKRGVFRSLVDLQAAINRFLDDHNQHPKPFSWTADPGKIIAAVKRGHQALDSFR